jgi:Spy/CpxP family protein refolding chaperone
MNKAIALVVLAALVPLGALAQTVSPYGGQEQRSIKALSPDEVKAYLAGEGMGLAKAGELNHYPGPKHILAMADHLGLTAAQRARIEAAEKTMSATAVPRGRAIVDAEADLDGRFAAGTIDAGSLRAATLHIAELQGRLRAAHLLAHIQTRAALDAGQIAMYDTMRGYDVNGDSAKHMH